MQLGDQYYTVLLCIFISSGDTALLFVSKQKTITLALECMRF